MREMFESQVTINPLSGQNSAWITYTGLAFFEEFFVYCGKTIAPGALLGQQGQSHMMKRFVRSFSVYNLCRTDLSPE